MIPLKHIKTATERVFSRSSGPGGQHVNKTSSRVQLTFDILACELSTVQKNRLMRKFPNGFVRVLNQDTRSQSQNTRMAFERLQQLVEKALRVEKKRKRVIAPHLKPAAKRRKMRQDKLQKYRRRKLLD